MNGIVILLTAILAVAIAGTVQHSLEDGKSEDRDKRSLFLGKSLGIGGIGLAG